MDQQRIDKITEALYNYSASVIKEGILQYTSLEELLELSLYPIERTAFRAAWAAEHVLLANNNSKITFYKDAIISVYSKSNNWSVLRSYSKLVMEYLTLTDITQLNEIEFESILNKTFDVLENSECPIAVRCNCYDILCLLSAQHHWIVNELRNRIQLDLSINETPALISRAKKVNKKLERIAKT